MAALASSTANPLDIPALIENMLTALSSGEPDKAVLDSLSTPVVDAMTNAVGAVLSLSTDNIGKYSLAFIKNHQVHYPDTQDEARELSAVGTSVLQNLELRHGLFKSLAERLTTAQHPRVSISVFASAPDSQRLGPHVDKWDNLVVQLKGNKDFLFAEETTSLRRGDVLYIPQDVSHDVRTLEDSIHLSLVLLRPVSPSTADEI